MSAPVDRSELLALALKAAHTAGELLSQRPDNFELSTKSVAIDFATQMDKASEKAIVDLILAARPTDGIVAEEGSARESSSGITWVIDPLDGTVNYFYGMPGWNVSIAAQDEHGSVVGVVYAPTINSLWHAVRDGGAFLNDKAIRCNESVPLNRALLGTGFQYDIKDRPEHIAKVASLLMTIRDIRRNGAAAVDLCYVAMGALDGYFELGLKPWDLAAGSLIATEAGAKVVASGPGGAVTVAAGPALLLELLATLAI